MAGPWEQYQKQPVGPWTQYQPSAPQSSKPQADTVSELGESALGGAQQGLLAGYAPQVAGGIAKLLGTGTEDIDKDLKAKGFNIPDPKLYLHARDEETARQTALQEKAPGSYIGGQLLGAGLGMAGPGAIASMAKGGGLALKGASVASKASEPLTAMQMISKTPLLMAKGAAGGAAQGAIQNPGDVEGKIDPIQLEKRGENLKTGALIGGSIPAAGTVMGLGSKALSSVGGKAEDLANFFSAKALGVTKADFKKLSQIDPTGMTGETVRKLGKFASDTGIVSPGDAPEVIANKASLYKQKIGQQIGDIYKQADAMLSGEMPKTLTKQETNILKETVFNKKNIIEDVRNAAKEKFKTDLSGSEHEKILDKMLDNFERHPKDVFGIQDLQDIKTQLDDKIFKAGSSELKSGIVPENKEALMFLRDSIKNRMQDRLAAIDKVFGPLAGDMKTTLTDLNKQYGLAAKAHTIAKNQDYREAGNKMFSLTDKIIGAEGMGLKADIGAGLLGGGAHAFNGRDEDEGGGGGLVGSIGKGLLYAGLSKAARTYALPPAVSMFRGIAKGAQSIPTALPSSLQKGAGLIEGTPAGRLGAAAVRGLMQTKNGVK